MKQLRLTLPPQNAYVELNCLHFACWLCVVVLQKQTSVTNRALYCQQNDPKANGSPDCFADPLLRPGRRRYRRAPEDDEDVL